ncbi:glutathione-disulfide reductase [Parvularcula marina]|uniref:Glutathione-disulfide reductase n=1 Tax=Parvularcula marina TaxID=2292771 RepID=A0A371R852_9PROT|nr:glutathione-disulfide reductase [Parvularcula marina]RFB01633.1 glutathione-disulfide reductase [Parvularcula marina]
MSYDYDLFVIGAGSGGVRAANRAAQAGAKVGIAEERETGGTCVLRGCVPKKLMVYASQFSDLFKDAKGYGWTIGDSEFDWPTLRDTIQAELKRLTGLYNEGLAGNGVERIPHRAVVKDPHTVHIVEENRDVTAEKILVAVGGRPSLDRAADPDRIGIVSDDVFHLEEFPKRLVVAGGGYIALEFAHVFARLGAEVTLVYRGQTLLRNFDAGISARVESDLALAGIRYIPETVFTRLWEEGGEKHVELITGEVIDCDQILWAIGRTPNTEGLGLDLAGVEMGPKGEILTDDDYRTNVESIFALGDVTDRENLTPVAIREAMALVSTQFKDTPKRMEYDFIPKAVFTQPPVGTVGLSEKECLARGLDIEVYETDFRAMRNILAGNDERFYAKMIVEKGSEKVLALHMVGADAPEMIQLAAVAIKAGLTKTQFDETCAVHPTAAEELVTLARKRPGQA